MKFIRQDAHKKAKLKKVWRRPKGLHNKVRLQKKGYRKMPKVGMGTPNNVKNTLNGKELVRISAVDQLSLAKGKVIVLASVGMKKKIAIIEEGLKQKLEFNFDANKVLSNFKKEITERKEASQKYQKEREQKQKEAAKAEEKSEKKETEEKTEEEKKKELDKELIKRQ